MKIPLRSERVFIFLRSKRTEMNDLECISLLTNAEPCLSSSKMSKHLFRSMKKICQKAYGWNRLHLYGLGYPRQPSPRDILGELTFHLFLREVQRTVYMRITKSSWGGETNRGASCLTSAGRVTLAGGTTFSHRNTLSRLPGTVFACLLSRNVWFLV